jgi:uncharacterized protein YndB with AHSA1/START domain
MRTNASTLRAAVPAASPQLRIRRVYRVSPEKVWRAWTDPRALSRWLGRGAADSVSSAELDVRVGGRYRIAFVPHDGSQHVAAGVYREVVENRRLVFTWTRHGMPELESLVTIELTAVPDGTQLDFLHDHFPDVASRDDHQGGWLPTFAKLGTYFAASLTRHGDDAR